MDKETLNTIFEGLIGVTVVVGAGLLANAHAMDTAIIGLSSGALMAVLSFYYGQRGSTKAVNGNISALASIASQLATNQQILAQNAPQAPAKSPEEPPHAPVQ